MPVPAADSDTIAAVWDKATGDINGYAFEMDLTSDLLSKRSKELAAKGWFLWDMVSYIKDRQVLYAAYFDTHASNTRSEAHSALHPLRASCTVLLLPAGVTPSQGTVMTPASGQHTASLRLLSCHMPLPGKHRVSCYTCAWHRVLHTEADVSLPWHGYTCSDLSLAPMCLPQAGH
jgi:hypothetical protein